MITDGRLKPCPFCGKVPMIYVCDDEGNIHEDDYVNDPWSGLCYAICHEYDKNESNDKICPISMYEGELIGTQLYDTIDELVERWNSRI